MGGKTGHELMVTTTHHLQGDFSSWLLARSCRMRLESQRYAGPLDILLLDGSWLSVPVSIITSLTSKWSWASICLCTDLGIRRSTLPDYRTGDHQDCKMENPHHQKPCLDFPFYWFHDPGLLKNPPNSNNWNDRWKGTKMKCVTK